MKRASASHVYIFVIFILYNVICVKCVINNEKITINAVVAGPCSAHRYIESITYGKCIFTNKHNTIYGPAFGNNNIISFG